MIMGLFVCLICFNLILLIASNVAAVIVDRRTDIDVEAWHIINGTFDLFVVLFIVLSIADFFKGFAEIILPFLSFYLK